jgi:hypothetical protein
MRSVYNCKQYLFTRLGGRLAYTQIGWHPCFSVAGKRLPWPELAVLVKLGWPDCLADAETRLGCVGCLVQLTTSGEPSWEPMSAGE